MQSGPSETGMVDLLLTAICTYSSLHGKYENKAENTVQRKQAVSFLCLHDEEGLGYRVHLAPGQ